MDFNLKNMFAVAAVCVAFVFFAAAFIVVAGKAGGLFGGVMAILAMVGFSIVGFHKFINAC